uniref:Odorant receptor n=1 Tax=Culicoides sonorensis TaxID=179676 RepID=A0A336MV92_CULSO
MANKILNFADRLINRFILDGKLFKNPLFNIPLNGLKIFGYLISRDQWVWKPHCFRGTVFTITFVLFNISQYIDLVQLWGNLDEMMQNASTTLLFTTTVIRMFSFYWNRSRYLAVIREVDTQMHPILNGTHKEEKKIFFSYIKYARTLTIAFISIAVITANGMNIYSFIQSFFYDPDSGLYPPTILRSWFPTNDIWGHFYHIYAVQFYIMWLGIIIVSSWHTFVLSLMVYCIAMLQILNYRFEHFDDYVMESLPEKVQQVVWNTRKFRIVDNVAEYDVKAVEIFEEFMEEHRRILRYVRELSHLIGIYVFADFIIYSALICALLFQTSETSDEIQKIIGIFYIVTMIVILWIHYWHANEISVHNSELAKSMFMSNWYDQSRKFKKMFLMFSQTNTPPVKMRASVLVITLDVFINILRASYSYFTLLNQIKG